MLLTATRGILRQSRGLVPRAEPAFAAWSSRTTTSTKDGLPGSDTHDDFKPQIKTEPSASVEEVIKRDLQGNPVFVYMKGEPEAPMCGFSNVACRILDAYRVPYGSRNVLADPELREAIKKFSQWPTIPQIYVKGEFIGGSDLLMEMHQKGELETVLRDAQQ